MKSKSFAAERTVRQSRASVTTRRKMASLRVSLQRRRLRQAAQLYTGSSAIFGEQLADPNSRGNRSQ